MTTIKMKREAFYEGRDAAKAGHGRESCPHSTPGQGQLRTVWWAGWYYGVTGVGPNCY